MHVTLTVLFVSLLLVSCGGKDSRYRDTEMFERPPTLAIVKGIDEPAVEPDVSVVPKKSGKPGLRKSVYLVESEPLKIKIKQNFDDAWRSVGLALKQSEIKITDHNRERGLYYLYYGSKGLFGMFSHSDAQHEANFMLTLEPEEGEIKVTAIPINATEQNDIDKAATSDQEALLRDLYETLHDDLKEE
jgi:uncharacterized lipoprotein